jgi:16S rRNA (cytosine1407-C5)-methyltransferase
MEKKQLPQKFKDRLQEQFPKEFETILRSFHKRPPVLRVNTILTTPDEMRKKLKKTYGIETLEISFLPNALEVTKATRKELTDLPEYKVGMFYIQSVASQLVVHFLDPQPGEKILDLCAAPGSKTTQIAIQMECRGELIANELNKDRFFKLTANLQHQKVNHFVTTKKYPGQNYPAFYPEYFDRVLVDAPCSSESRFIDGEAKTYQYWSQPKVKALSKLQRRLLSAAIRCTKGGGTIVYSTCSLAPEENELVVNDILKKHPEVELQKIRWKEASLPLLAKWNEKPIHQELSKTLRLFPDRLLESFFMAVFRKVKTVPLNAQANKLGIQKKQKYNKDN